MNVPSTKIYIAGRLSSKRDRERLEEVEKLCSSLGFKTFLPHRDVGLCEGIQNVKKIFEEDIINGFKNCKGVVAVLEGLHVGAGTAWEMGYAYAKGIPVIGLKTDEPIEKALEYLSAILIHSIEIATSNEKLKQKLIERFG